jgi:hypothetical protein
MTPKQMYSELSKIAGHRCGDDRPFIQSRRVSKAHIEIIQARMAALLEKLSYSRSVHDFPALYRPFRERQNARARRRTERLTEREMEEAVPAVNVVPPPVPDRWRSEYLQRSVAQALAAETPWFVTDERVQERGEEI